MNKSKLFKSKNNCFNNRKISNGDSKYLPGYQYRYFYIIFEYPFYMPVIVNIGNNGFSGFDALKGAWSSYCIFSALFATY